MTEDQLERIFELIRTCLNDSAVAGSLNDFGFEPRSGHGQSERTHFDRQRFLDAFEIRVGQIRQALTGPLADLPDDALRLAIMCSLLRPKPTTPTMPVELFERLLTRIREDIPGQPEWIPEYAIAYGCGLGRTLATDGGAWSGKWPRARHAFVSLFVAPVVEQVRRYLGNRLVSVKRDSGSDDEGTAIFDDALRLTMILLNPYKKQSLNAEQGLLIEAVSLQSEEDAESEGVIARIHDPDNDAPIKLWPGERYVFTIVQGQGELTCPKTTAVAESGDNVIVIVTDDKVRISYPNGSALLKPGQKVQLSGHLTIRVWACTSGTKDFETKHDFFRWDLKRGLDLLVKEAIFNYPNIRSLKDSNIKQFVLGLYFAYLSSGKFGYCWSDAHNEKPWRLRLVPFEKPRYPDADRARRNPVFVDTSEHDWKLATHLVVVELHSNFIPGYRRVRRYKCKECGNLFEENLERCPLAECGEKKGQNLTHVYVRDPRVLRHSESFTEKSIEFEVDQMIAENWHHSEKDEGDE